MPLTLNIGLSKKIGQPDFGSLGASCSVAVELDSTLIRDDLDTFHTQVRRAYAAYILQEENPESINGWMKTIVMEKVKE